MRAAEQVIIIPLVQPWRRDSSLRSLASRRWFRAFLPNDDRLLDCTRWSDISSVERIVSCISGCVTVWWSLTKYHGRRAHPSGRWAQQRRIVSSCPAGGRVGVLQRHLHVIPQPRHSPLTILGDETILCKYINTHGTALWDFSYKENWTKRSEKDGSTIFRLGRIVST